MVKSSYYSGQKFAEKVFFDSIEKYGANAQKHYEKTMLTCAEYASNMNIRKTKKGVELTKNKRQFYQGAFDFFVKPTYMGYYD